MVCRGTVCGVEGANMAMGKENLEDIYAELLNSPVTSKTNYMQRDETKPFVRSFESYLSDTKTKSSPIRGEMDYFVSRSPEFGINISWVSSQTEGLTYDYCTFAAPDGSSQLYHAQLMVPEPLKMYPHRHDYFELVYVLSGRFQQTIGNQWVTMEQDDLLLLDTSTVHTEYIAEDGVVQYLQIPKAVMEAVFQEITRSKDLDEFFAASMLKQNSKYRYISYANCGAYPRALLEQMLREGRRGAGKQVCVVCPAHPAYGLDRPGTGTAPQLRHKIHLWGRQGPGPAAAISGDEQLACGQERHGAGPALYGELSE